LNARDWGHCKVPTKEQLNRIEKKTRMRCGP
jgi:hypothetical protein